MKMALMKAIDLCTVYVCVSARVVVYVCMRLAYLIANIYVRV